MKARAVACTCSAAAVWALCGCAGIEYQKVPTPTQYETWDDERQAEADAMEGVRYYLPRPFLEWGVRSYATDAREFFLEALGEVPGGGIKFA